MTSNGKIGDKTYTYSYDKILSYFYVQPTTIYFTICNIGFADTSIWLANDANDSTKQYFFARFTNNASSSPTTPLQVVPLPFVFQ